MGIYFRYALFFSIFFAHQFLFPMEQKWGFSEPIAIPKRKGSFEHNTIRVALELTSALKNLSEIQNVKVSVPLIQSPGSDYGLQPLRGMYQQDENQQYQPALKYIKNDRWFLSIDQIKDCLQIVYNARLVCDEYHYTCYLTKEFTEFVNRFAQNTLSVSRYGGPKNYMRELKAATQEGCSVRREFAVLVKLFDSWRRANNPRDWHMYMGVERFARKWFNVNIEDND